MSENKSLNINPLYKDFFERIRSCRFTLNNDIKYFYTFDNFVKFEIKLDNQSLLINLWKLLLDNFSGLYRDLYDESLEDSELRIDADCFSNNVSDRDEIFFSLVKVKFTNWNCFLDELEDALRSKFLQDLEINSAYFNLCYDLHIQVSSCSQEIWQLKENKH